MEGEVATPSACCGPVPRGTCGHASVSRSSRAGWNGALWTLVLGESCVCFLHLLNKLWDFRQVTPCF